MCPGGELGGKKKRKSELKAHKGELFLRFCFLKQETWGSAEIRCCSENIKEPSALLEYFSLSGNVVFRGNVFPPSIHCSN